MFYDLTRRRPLTTDHIARSLGVTMRDKDKHTCPNVRMSKCPNVHPHPSPRCVNGFHGFISTMTIEAFDQLTIHLRTSAPLVSQATKVTARCLVVRTAVIVDMVSTPFDSTRDTLSQSLSLVTGHRRGQFIVVMLPWLPSTRSCKTMLPYVTFTFFYKL